MCSCSEKKSSRENTKRKYRKNTLLMFFKIYLIQSFQDFFRQVSLKFQQNSSRFSRVPPKSPLAIHLRLPEKNILKMFSSKFALVVLVRIVMHCLKFFLEFPSTDFHGDSLQWSRDFDKSYCFVTIFFSNIFSTNFFNVSTEFLHKQIFRHYERILFKILEINFRKTQK